MNYFQSIHGLAVLFGCKKEGTQAAPYLQKYDPKIKLVAKALQGQAGSREVLVKNSKKLRVGDVLELQWFNRKGESGALLNELYGQTDLKIGSHHWTKPGRPLVRQKTEIVSINGNSITISDPLLHTISEQIPAQFAQWQHMVEVGIEDMHLRFPDAPSFGHHLEQGYNGIYFTSVYNGWIRNLKITNADSGILTYNSANLTIKDIVSDGDRRGHYAVHTGNVHNVLVQGLMIHNPLVHSLSINTQATKSVFLDAHVFKTPVLDQHAGSNHQNLFDNIHVYFSALRDKKGKPYYPIWDGSGAGYWQPGHGRYNTTWNLNVTVLGGADRTEKVTLLGKAEGPEARVVGISGNREFEVDYRPAPYLEAVNQEMSDVPSLYRWQLRQRQN
ncbi:MAG: right-handed parallel beta-helix repeat-containing protein, partial [Acidiferrobacterales bacterium]|nr:right-handed parallel beta-helix repeat-containing protein [Acidiferrobacterales bacterium]